MGRVVTSMPFPLGEKKLALECIILLLSVTPQEEDRIRNQEKEKVVLRSRRRNLLVGSTDFVGSLSKGRSGHYVQ